jgi:hypothetical protein
MKHLFAYLDLQLKQMPMTFFLITQIKIEGKTNGQIFAQSLRVLRSGIYRREPRCKSIDVSEEGVASIFMPNNTSRKKEA